MKDGRKLLLKYSITAGVALIATLFIMWLKDFESAEALHVKYQILSDAFSVPGALLMLFTGLLWASSEGIFDGLGYSFNRFGSMFIPMYKKSLEHKTYYDYKKEKEQKRPHGYSFMFFVGLFFFLVGIVFMILFKTVYVPKV